MNLADIMGNAGRMAHEATSALGNAQRGATWAGPYVHQGSGGDHTAAAQRQSANRRYSRRHGRSGRYR